MFHLICRSPPQAWFGSGATKPVGLMNSGEPAVLNANRFSIQAVEVGPPARVPLQAARAAARRRCGHSQAIRNPALAAPYFPTTVSHVAKWGVGLIVDRPRHAYIAFKYVDEDLSA